MKWTYTSRRWTLDEDPSITIRGDQFRGYRLWIDNRLVMPAGHRFRDLKTAKQNGEARFHLGQVGRR